MIPAMVRDAVDVLIQRNVIPEEYREDMEQSVDLEMRRKAKLYGTTLARRAMTNVIATRMIGQLVPTSNS